MWQIFGIFWPPPPFMDHFTKYCLCSNVGIWLTPLPYPQGLWMPLIILIFKPNHNHFGGRVHTFLKCLNCPRTLHHDPLARLSIFHYSKDVPYRNRFGFLLPKYFFVRFWHYQNMKNSAHTITFLFEFVQKFALRA